MVSVGLAEVLKNAFPDWSPPKGDSNAWLPCRCPWHKDSNASGSIHYAKQYFKCFSCDIHGGVNDIARLLGATVPTVHPTPVEVEETQVGWLHTPTTKARIKMLTSAARQYYKDASDSLVEKYLYDRFGRHSEKVYSQFGLGFVREPSEGHERFKGMLSIPYFRPTDPMSVAAIRFRCISCPDKHQGHGKYMGEAGVRALLYNTPALTKPGDRIGITEGEADTWALQVSGVMRAIGVPGATSWKEEWGSLIEGYPEVYVFPDADEAGEKMVKAVIKSRPDAKVVRLDPGQDVCSTWLEQGESYLEGLL